MSGGGAVKPAWLSLVGIGEDGVAGLGAEARALIGQAALVVGGARHLALAAPLIGGERLAWPSPMQGGYDAILARQGEPVVVLASGDPFQFGVGTALAALVPPGALRCLPAPSCISLACARLGWAVQDVAVLSFCGRPLAALIPRLHPGARLVLLSADETTPAAVAALLRAQGCGASTLHVMEALGGPHERVRRCTAEAVPSGIGRLNLVAAEIVGAPADAALADAAFAHDGQLTKQEVRAVTVAALGACGALWDVGAGSGSVAIAWSLAASGRRAVAVEQDAARAERARGNAERLGAVAVAVVQGRAPAALAGLGAPDAVFVGGGLQQPGVFEACWAALPPGGRLVANAVALDTQALLFGLQATHGGALTRIGIERLDRIGAMRAFRPAMPVVQWAVQKP